jgi:Chlorophyll A-B binding protein
MKSTIVASLLLASQVVAFAPHSQNNLGSRSATTTELHAVLDSYPGAINLFRKEFKFDPLKLSETYEPLVPWFRESELKHGRTAMLAVVGFIVQDFVRLPGAAYSFETVPKTIDAHDTLMAMGPSSPMGQLVLWIGLWDLIVTAPAAYASHKGLRTPGGTYLDRCGNILLIPMLTYPLLFVV